jgi:hypothetical protein
VCVYVCPCVCVRPCVIVCIYVCVFISLSKYTTHITDDISFLDCKGVKVVCGYGHLGDQNVHLNIVGVSIHYTHTYS